MQLTHKFAFPLGDRLALRIYYGYPVGGGDLFGNRNSASFYEYLLIYFSIITYIYSENIFMSCLTEDNRQW